MPFNLKPIWSICVIVFFILIAYATTWDEILTHVSTNTTVAIKDCEAKPQALGKLGISIHATEPDGTAAITEVDIYITHQKVKPDECIFEILHDLTLGFNLDNDGNYGYSGFEYEHNNSQDLIRVEVNINGRPGRFEDWKSVQVKYYNQGDFHFEATLKKPL